MDQQPEILGRTEIAPTQSDLARRAQGERSRDEDDLDKTSNSYSTPRADRERRLGRKNP